MNKLILKVSVFAVFLLLSSNVVWAEQTRASTAPTTEARPMESLSLNFSKVVPAGKKYVIYNDKGRKIRTIKAGETTAAVTDCAQIPCPSTFGDDVVCWKCVERITSNSSPTE